MNKYSLSALVAAGLLAGGVSAGSASAADLGGNCCADLEERIAELEATTARKGNRKVSLTVSGWVGQQIMWWDNGDESNVYVHDLGSTLGSHVKFTGQATIVPGWTAGYVLHIEAIGSDSLTMNEDNPSGPALYQFLNAGATAGNGVQTLQSFWFIKSDQLGKVSVGLQSQASDNTAILVDGSGSLVPANWVAFDVNSFSAIGSLANTWGNMQSCRGMGGAWGDCNGLTHNVVRYDSPTFAGFSVSASWGEDDMWDVAGRYAGEWGDFKVAAAAAYNEVHDPNYNNLGNLLGVTVDARYFQVGAYVEHVPTGLWALFNYGHLEQGAGSTFFGAPDADTYYVKAGIRQRWNPLGHTILYGEYLRGNDGSVNLAAAGDSSELNVWGGGIVQEIDAAAMSMWVKYRHLDGEETVGGTKYTAEDFQYVGVGALINF
jgi:predicted porin